jgi:FKBP-type peptidyl-prolyl cis-trans isomerase
LRASLDDISAVQQTTATRVATLELRLKEQQQEHDADLQQTLARERRLARRLMSAMTVAAAAFVLGIVGSAVNFWEVRNTTRLLTEVSQGIREIRISMESRPAAPTPASSPLSTPAAREEPVSVGTPPPLPDAGGGTAQESDAARQESAGQKLPEPYFIASKTLPLDGHTFSSRQDASAFFEENGKQPGVLVLPGGLQYRVLIPGTGKSPGAGDQVVVEYRSFRPDGTETDNSFREESPMTLTVDKAIPGLREALPHMREGAQWELYIPANLVSPGIRKRGRTGFEPLIMTVELISVLAAEPAN